MSLPPHGVPMKISEIISAGIDLNGKSVRTVGRVDQYDVHRSIAILSEPSKSTFPSLNMNMKLTVDTSLTDGSDYRLGSQIMLIGELENCHEDETLKVGYVNVGIVLKARISRSVDQLDYAIYCKTLDLWRSHDLSEH